MDKKYSSIILVICLPIFYLFAAKMLSIVGYDRDYLRDSNYVQNLQKRYDRILTVNNDVEPPSGKRILVPLIVKTLSYLSNNKMSFVRLNRQIDCTFIFIALIGFHFLLAKSGFDLKKILFGIVIVCFYSMYGFARILPIFRFSDIANIMFLIWGLYFMLSNFKIAFLANLFVMSFNRETGIFLILILMIKVFLDNFGQIRKKILKEMKGDFLFIFLAIITYLSVQAFLTKVFCKNGIPWGGVGVVKAIKFYGKMNFSITGFKYFINWFNVLIILSVINFFSKSNFVKASLIATFLYILSVYLVGGIFGEGEGLLLPIIPVLVLASLEELKNRRVI